MALRSVVGDTAGPIDRNNEEREMTVYMAERHLPGISMDDLAQAQRRAIDTAASMTAEGTSVSYLRSTFVPEDGRCLCLFEAENAADVEALNREAQLPFERVVEALDLQPAAS